MIEYRLLPGFLAVPVFGVTRQGLRAYLRHYIEPNPIMLPFNVIGDLSRTLALAVRLFGNIMSGTKIVAVLVGIVPLLFPIVFRALGLLTGLIQAYIFAVLAMVYIASAMTVSTELSCWTSMGSRDTMSKLILAAPLNRAGSPRTA